MTLNEYQKSAWSTALPEAKNANYMLLGLVNEVGEIAGAVKKHLRGDFPDKDLMQKIKKELGDSQWYLAGLAKCLDMNLNDIAIWNLDKLYDRQRRGVLRGDGDDR